jgi:hypothetical protein
MDGCLGYFSLAMDVPSSSRIMVSALMSQYTEDSRDQNEEENSEPK